MVPVETRLLPAAVAALVVASALLCEPSSAKEPDIYLPIQGFAHSSDGMSSSQPWQSSGSEAPSLHLVEPTSAPLASPTARFRLVELPADGSPVGVAKRPHHAIGFRWLGAESWLREHGVDARTCYLPMVRLHTRISASFNLSGTLWVYGRCSFK